MNFFIKNFREELKKINKKRNLKLSSFPNKKRFEI